MSHALHKSIGLRTADIHIKTSKGVSGSAVGTVYSYADGQFELSLGAYPAEGSTLIFDMTSTENITDASRPLAAIIQGSLDEVRLEIGQVEITDNVAQASFFGIPPFDARIVF